MLLNKSDPNFPLKQKFPH